jgi:hypothetical protein
MSQLAITTNGSHEEYGQLAACLSDHYFSGRSWLKLYCYSCTDYSGSHLCPTVNVEVSMCIASAERTTLNAMWLAPLRQYANGTMGGPRQKNFEDQIPRRYQVTGWNCPGFKLTELNWTELTLVFNGLNIQFRFYIRYTLKWWVISERPLIITLLNHMSCTASLL